MLDHPGARRLEELRASFERDRKVTYDVNMLDLYGSGSEGTAEAAELASLRATEQARKSEYAALLARLRAEDPEALRAWALGYVTLLEDVAATATGEKEAAFARRLLAQWHELLEGKRDVIEGGALPDYVALLR